MIPGGKLIAIEGIDGAGKRTQAGLLSSALEVRGIACVRFGFPQYETFFGRLVGSFLNGDFGELESVDPHFSALLYAGNRLEAKPALQEALAAGKTVLTDRYIGSNLAHQGARIPPGERAEFFAWLRQLEYGVYGLPSEDLVIFLRRAPSEAQQMVGRKKARSYTERRHDLQEADLSHLEEASRVYDQLAAGANWATVECTNPAGSALKAPEEIQRAVMAAVEARLFASVTAR